MGLGLVVCLMLPLAPQPVMPGQLDAAPASSPGSVAADPPSAISRVAWQPQGDLDQAKWLASGRRLGSIGRGSRWWLGDWIRYGASRWGEHYREAARITGFDVVSLREMGRIAARFDLSLRRDKLTWDHHVLLAPLELEQRRYWLERAEKDRLTVADLRLELRAAREQPSENAELCPHCGHRLPARCGE